jgi:hypothetical protein
MTPGEDQVDMQRELRKRAIFDRMSTRQQARIRRIGYDAWDPFEAPKDPIDIRRDPTCRTTQQLVREYLATLDAARRSYSNAYAGGVLEMALGIVNEEDRLLGMYEFAQWYAEQRRKHGLID